MTLNKLAPSAFSARRFGVARAVAVFFVALFAFAQTSTLFAEETEQKLDPLAWRSDLALWTAVVFVLLLLVLKKFAFGPIVQALDQRERNENDRLAAVEKANADAKELLEQYKRKLADSEEEVRRILAEARDDAGRQAAAIVDEAKLAAQDERARAVQDVQAATDVALQEIATKSATLATELAGKLIRETIDPAKHKELIENAVADFVK